MSNNLNITQVQENQASPEVTINDALAAHDAALTEQFAVNLTSGNVSVTAAQYRAAFYFPCSGVATAGRTVTFPAVKRTVLAKSASANTDDISIVVGSTSVTVHPGDRFLVVTDGTTNGLEVFKLQNISPPFDLHAFVPGVGSNAQLCIRVKATRAFSLPASLTGSFVTAVTAATASTTYTLKKNGSSIGTAVFAISGVTATLTFASLVAFASGDVLTIEGPGTADSTLADVSFDLKGILG
jgi:hypothetical protein